MLRRFVLWVDARILSGIQRICWRIQKKARKEGLNYLAARLCIFFFCAIQVCSMAGPALKDRGTVLFIMLLLFGPIGLLLYGVSRLVEDRDRSATQNPRVSPKDPNFFRVFRKGRIILSWMSLVYVVFFIVGLYQPGGPPLILRVLDLVGLLCAPTFMYFLSCCGYGQPDRASFQEVSSSSPPPPPA